MMKRLDKGLDYFGFKPNYAPERAWTTIKGNLDNIMQHAKEKSDSIDSLFKRINLGDKLSEASSSLVKTMIIPFKQELLETGKLVEMQKSLKEETIQVRIVSNYFIKKKLVKQIISNIVLLIDTLNPIQLQLGTFIRLNICIHCQIKLLNISRVSADLSELGK